MTHEGRLGALNGAKLNWAISSRLLPTKTVARIIKKHLWGIGSAVLFEVSNGASKRKIMNSSIQDIKIRSGGFRNMAHC